MDPIQSSRAADASGAPSGANRPAAVTSEVAAEVLSPEAVFAMHVPQPYQVDPDSVVMEFSLQDLDDTATCQKLKSLEGGVWTMAMVDKETGELAGFDPLLTTGKIDTVKFIHHGMAVSAFMPKTEVLISQEGGPWPTMNLMTDRPADERLKLIVSKPKA